MTKIKINNGNYNYIKKKNKNITFDDFFPDVWQPYSENEAKIVQIPLQLKKWCEIKLKFLEFFYPGKN